MKQKLSNILALVVGSCIIAHSEDVPTGSISSPDTVVTPGTYATLNWGIKYPVNDPVEDPLGRPTFDTDTFVTCRFIVASISANAKLEFRTIRNETIDGVTKSIDTLHYNDFSENSGEEYEIEAGGEIVFENMLLEAFETIDFRAKHPGAGGGHGIRDRPNIGGGIGFVSSKDPFQAHHCISLRRGDSLPIVTYVNPNERTLEEIMTPYMKDGVLDIAENEEVILYELWTNVENGLGWEMQDLILHLTYNNVDPEYYVTRNAE